MCAAGWQIAVELRATYLHRIKLIHKASSHHYLSLRKRLMKIQLEETLKAMNQSGDAAPRCVGGNTPVGANPSGSRVLGGVCRGVPLGCHHGSWH